MAYWFVAAGMLLLLVGTEATVRGSVGLARGFGVSPLLIGVLIIAPAAAAPELIVTLRAATIGAPSMAISGVVGACIFNVLFVLGLGALIHPMVSPPKVVLRDGGAMVLGSVALAMFGANGIVSRVEGCGLLGALVLYVAFVIVSDWRRAPDHSVPLSRALYRSEGAVPSAASAGFLLLLGLVLLFLGAHFLIGGSEALAREQHWRMNFVGLTVVAIGMSLPMLAATLVAAARQKTGIAVGQLIGGNVFAQFAVLGIAALLVPLAIARALATVDIVVLVVASVVVLPLLALRWRLSRPRGIFLVLAYACYFAFLLWRQGLVELPML